MSNRRMITSSLFEDTFIAHLSPFERLLWIGLIVAGADDQGRMVDSPALLRAKIFPFDEDVSVAQVECGLVKLAQAKKITRYTTTSGSELIQIVKWWRHQSPAWAAPSIYPAPREWQDRIRCHGQGNQIILFEWEGRGGYIRGYVGRYVSEEVDNYIPACLCPVHMPINDVKVKEEVKSKGDGEGDGELCAVIGVNAPVPLASPPPPPPPVEEPLLSGVDVSPGERLNADLDFPRLPKFSETSEVLMRTFAYSEGIRYPLPPQFSAKNEATDMSSRILQPSHRGEGRVRALVRSPLHGLGEEKPPGFLCRGGFGWIRALIRSGAKPTPAAPIPSFPGWGRLVSDGKDRSGEAGVGFAPDRMGAHIQPNPPLRGKTRDPMQCFWYFCGIMQDIAKTPQNSLVRGRNETHHERHWLCRQRYPGDGRFLPGRDGL